MMPDIKTSEVVFFLGAGASVAAGVPDTYAFVDEYIKSIQEPTKKETIEKIVQTLKEWKYSNVDIELLLETLTKLDNKEREPLLQFYKNGNFILEGDSEKKPLISGLRDFIKTKAIVSEDKIQYLRPLLDFVEEYETLDIISLNYDICIEQFCNVHKLSYQDGFDIYWNPKIFASEHNDIRLYKLHGSVMWYESDKGGYIKLPVKSEASEIQLITGEKAKTLMLYPMQKWEYAEPLLELLVLIKHHLETCKYLIVVGYSFRDDHIRKLLWDAARRNKELHLILVDPNAWSIYAKKLKYYDINEGNPSSLNGRVICLSDKFEDILLRLKNVYIKNLQEALKSETSQRQAEIGGQKTNWSSTLKLFSEAGHMEKVESLLKIANKNELGEEYQRNYEILELSLQLAVSFSAYREENMAKKYIEDFNKFLYEIVVNRIHVKISERFPSLEIHFNYSYIPNNSSLNCNCCIRGEAFGKYIEALNRICEIKKEKNKFLESITKELKDLKDYLQPFIFMQDGINIGEYCKLRKDQIPDVKQFENECEDFSEDKREKIALRVKEIEKSILKEIISIKT